MTTPRPLPRVPGDEAVLRTVAEVAAHLASEIASEDGVARVAEILQRGLRLRACHVWVRSRAGDAFLLATPAAGQAGAVVPDASAWLADASAWTSPVRRVLRAEGKALGLLEADPPDPPGAAIHDALEIVGDVLGLWLASSELSQDLASEVAFRTREIDEHRRFTTRIIDSLPVGLYVVDRHYRIQAWNRKREAGTQGVARDDALGRRVFEVLTRQPRELLQQEFDAVFETGRMAQMEVESTASGELRHFRITKIPMRLHDDEITHVITIGEDVTEWKAIHQQIAQTEKLAAVGQLAAGVMHELNNPLATIGACVEALTVRMPDLPPGDQQALDEYLRIIDSELERCRAIVNGLLDFSHPKAQAKQPESINQVVEDALFLIRHHDAFRNIVLVRELEDDLPPVYANAKQLVQVFLGLMLNAIDAMEGRGRLTVGTSVNPERRDEVLVTFSDTGLGIPREDLSKIFEPFFTTKVTGRGTGLGLSICYGVVQQHQGRILVDSQLGAGSTFKVYLPTARLPRGAPGRSSP